MAFCKVCNHLAESRLWMPGLFHDSRNRAESFTIAGFRLTSSPPIKCLAERREVPVAGLGSSYYREQPTNAQPRTRTFFLETFPRHRMIVSTRSNQTSLSNRIQTCLNSTERWRKTARRESFLRHTWWKVYRKFSRFLTNSSMRLTTSERRKCGEPCDQIGTFSLRQ